MPLENVFFVFMGALLFVNLFVTYLAFKPAVVRVVQHVSK